MKNRVQRTMNVLFAAVLITVPAYILPSLFGGAQVVSAVFGRAASADEGPPLSVAFHSNSVGNTEVYVMDPDGKEQTRLTFDPRVNQQPDISPNGQQIVYCGNPLTDTNPEGDLEIFIMDADGSS